MSDLKPCPFCGEDPFNGVQHGNTIGCQRCGIWFETIEAWNRRASTPEPATASTPKAPEPPADALVDRVAKELAGDETTWNRANGTIRSMLRERARRILSIAQGGLRVTGRDVHREWRDGMLAQGRKIAIERMEWDTLKDEDKALDDRIAAALSSLTRPEEPRANRDEGLRKLLESARHALRSYENGNQATGLARRVADRIESALAPHEEPAAKSMSCACCDATARLGRQTCAEHKDREQDALDSMRRAKAESAERGEDMP